MAVGQVAPVALADSQPTPRCVCEPSQIQQCCQADPQMIPATRAIRVLLHATRVCDSLLHGITMSIDSRYNSQHSSGWTITGLVVTTFSFSTLERSSVAVS